MSLKRYTFFAVALICAFALLIISVLLVYHYINKPSEIIIVHNIVISDEMNNQTRLTGTVSRFSYGTRQIFVFFDYEKASIGTKIFLCWGYGGKEFRTEDYELKEPSGSKVYCFLVEDGSILPKGAYSLNIMQDDKAVVPEYIFNIF
jgi:hypothetical protein